MQPQSQLNFIRDPSQLWKEPRAVIADGTPCQTLTTFRQSFSLPPNTCHESWMDALESKTTPILHFASEACGSPWASSIFLAAEGRSSVLKQWETKGRSHDDPNRLQVPYCNLVNQSKDGRDFKSIRCWNILFNMEATDWEPHSLNSSTFARGMAGKGRLRKLLSPCKPGSICYTIIPVKFWGEI